MSGFSIDFEVGDRVHCTYYNVTGTIVALKHNEGDLPWIIILPDDAMENTVRTQVVTRVKTTSLNRPFFPFYLQMVQKAGDIVAQNNNWSG